MVVPHKKKALILASTLFSDQTVLDNLVFVPAASWVNGLLEILTMPVSRPGISAVADPCHGPRGLYQQYHPFVFSQSTLARDA